MSNDAVCNCSSFVLFSPTGKMFIKLHVGLVLLCSYEILLVKGFPIVQGRNRDYSTLPSGEKFLLDAETEVEDSEINKIAASATLPRSTAATRDENIGELFVTNSFDLNQNHTSLSEMQGILKEHEASQNRPKFEENSNAYHTDFLLSVAESANGNKMTSESLVNTETATPKYQTVSIQTSQEDDHQKVSNYDSNFRHTVFVESLVPTPDSGSINLFTNSYYSDYGDLQNFEMNEHDMEGSMNDDENADFLKNDEDEDSLPSALKNLPHDIPPDRTIYEVLAENIVKDKQYDEIRIDELIHELMDHYDAHNGLGEVYAGEADYDEKESPKSKDSVPISELTIEPSSTALPYK